MGIVAVFHELDAAVDAIEDLKSQKITDFTVYTPTPRHEIEGAVSPPPSAVRKFTLIGGLAGVMFGYWVAMDLGLLAARGRWQGDRELGAVHDHRV